MANTIPSPNMFLPVPIQGVDPGPQYAIDVNSCLALIDSHDHTIGNGVRITPAGLNINSPLTMNNNLLTTILALTLFPQTIDPGINSIYEKGVDLYYRDGSGNVIRITQAGSVTGSPGTITGLPSGTASATFAAGTFTFQAATLTPANVDGGSFIFRNNTASSFGVTVSPINALGSNYTLVLPTIPAQTNVMTLDASGNMSSVTWNTVAENRTRTNGTIVGLGGIAISASSGSFVTSSGTYVDVTNLSVTITTSGRPIQLEISGDGSGNAASFAAINNGGAATADFALIVGASTLVNSVELGAAASLSVPPALTSKYIAVAGTYTFKMQARRNPSSSAINQTEVLFCTLTAYEL